MSTSSSTTTLVGSKTTCTMTEEVALKKCKDDENKAAAAAKTKADSEKKEAPKKYVAPKSSSGNLDCSMDGFNGMFSALIENIFIALALVKESFSYLIPAELSLAVQYGWDGLVGLGGWIGYLYSAVYFVGLDYGYGQLLCDVSGYGYYAIDGINQIVSFAKKSGVLDKPAADSTTTTT